LLLPPLLFLPSLPPFLPLFQFPFIPLLKRFKTKALTHEELLFPFSPEKFLLIDNAQLGQLQTFFRVCLLLDLKKLLLLTLKFLLSAKVNGQPGG
jgi:hypothetical protein